MSRSNRRNFPEETVPCPHCGEPIAQRATFCRACGASEDSGWDGAGEGPLDVGYDTDDEFDYDDFVRREFPDRSAGGSWGFSRPLLITVMILVLCAMLLVYAF
jgi:hypothetical protein